MANSRGKGGKAHSRDCNPLWDFSFNDSGNWRPIESLMSNCSHCGILKTYDECANKSGLWCTECAMIFNKGIGKRGPKSYLNNLEDCGWNEPRKIIFADGYAIVQKNMPTQLKLNSKFKRIINLKKVKRRKKEIIEARKNR